MSGPTPSHGAGRNQGGSSAGSTIWSWSAHLATAAGLGCALVSWDVTTVVLCVVLLVLVTGVIAASLWAEDGRRAVPRILRVAFSGGLAAPAAVALIVVLKLAGVLLVLALVATAPPVTSFFRARREAKGDVPGTPPGSPAARIPATSLVGGPAAEPVMELESLDDEAVCLAWRRSFRRLEAAVTAAERLAVVEQRQRYLDELDRRSPDGVAAWLAAGARASGNPLPYVADHRRRAS
ncbi:hypothetical protein AB0L64_33915 [Kribbella sp. NPDC051936]|uniref:hypothetical protein n=1 Tax=Kribbella sp. NPDC051936 TaxID=3154946 RepID=UPI00341F05DF